MRLALVDSELEILARVVLATSLRFYLFQEQHQI
jgi:hypothetical protein